MFIHGRKNHACPVNGLRPNYFVYRKRRLFLKTRMAYTKKNEARYIAHLDLTRVFDRALRRAKIKAVFTEGFNPHPKISFGPPLPVGVEGQREFVDMELSTLPDIPEKYFLEETVNKLQSQLPGGIELIDYAVRSQADKALTAVINLARYRTEGLLAGFAEVDRILEFCQKWLAREEVIGVRFQKGKKVERNIRPFVKRITVLAQEAAQADQAGNNAISMQFDIVTGNSGSVRPIEVLESLRDLAGLPVDLSGVYTVREGLFIEQPDGRLLDPIEILNLLAESGEAV
ncbi:MAG: hypothetical protein AWM53_00154 [Candidatus Dichloromethanomonas elyunquensis]|nr:MAG: hypothetical protein AWM53_00154 [Candidatus Dichloromethanomonas elyunquensis]